MNLKSLTDKELHESTLKSVAKERSALIEVLHHLKEVNRRKLFSTFKCKSLHEYAEKELKYPGHQAYARIAAMKLLVNLPEIEEKISNGSLNLTHLNDAKTVFNKKPHSKQEKLQLFETLSDKSTREAKVILVGIVPGIKFQDKVKPLTEDKMEFHFTGSYQLDEKLKELKGRLAHSYPNISLGELIEILADEALEPYRAQEPKVDNEKQIKFQNKNEAQYEQRMNQNSQPIQNNRKYSNQQPKQIIRKTQSNGPMQFNSEVQINKPKQIKREAQNNISKQLNQLLKIENSNFNKASDQVSKAEVIRQVWKRDNSKCVNCKSTYAIEVDHKIPKAKGGKDTLENLRLLCRNCNQRAAIEHYGINKMDKYLKTS